MPCGRQVIEQLREGPFQSLVSRRNEALEPVRTEDLLASPARQPQQVIIAEGDPCVPVERHRNQLDSAQHVAVAPLALAQCLLRMLALGDVTRHPANDRLRHSIRPQGVLVFPDPIFPRACLHMHHALGGPVFPDLVHVRVESLPGFRREKLTEIPLQKLVRSVPDDPGGPWIHGEDAPLQVVRADEVLAVLHEVPVPILALPQLVHHPVPDALRTGPCRFRDSRRLSRSRRRRSRRTARWRCRPSANRFRRIPRGSKHAAGRLPPRRRPSSKRTPGEAWRGRKLPRSTSTGNRPVPPQAAVPFRGTGPQAPSSPPWESSWCRTGEEPHEDSQGRKPLRPPPRSSPDILPSPGIDFRRSPPRAQSKSIGTTGPARSRMAAVEGDMRPVMISPILGGSGSSHSPREGVGIPKYCSSRARP